MKILTKLLILLALLIPNLSLAMEHSSSDEESISPRPTKKQKPTSAKSKEVVNTPSDEASSSTEDYRKYCHTHVNGREGTCTIKALYITKKTKLLYTNNENKSWEWLIVNEKDLEYVLKTHTDSNTDNHLFVGFEVIYREEDKPKSFFSHLYASKQRKVFEVKEVEENSSEGFYLADFWNIDNHDFSESKLDGHTVTCAPLYKEKVEKFNAVLRGQEEKQVSCTPNKCDGYHSEGMALAELYYNTDIFKKVIERVKTKIPSCIIEACFLKFYSKFDICLDCQDVLFRSRNLIEKKFNEEIKAENHALVPLFLVGLTMKNCGNSYWNLRTEDKKCNNEDVNNSKAPSFSGLIPMKFGSSQPFLFIKKT